MVRRLKLTFLLSLLVVPWFLLFAGGEEEDNWTLDIVFVWEPVSDYEDGSPCAVAGYAVGLFDEAEALLVDEGTSGLELPARNLFLRVPQGNGRRVWMAVKAVDEYGVGGEWSERISGVLRTSRPRAPQGVGCRGCR